MRLPDSTRVRGLLRCLDANFFVASFEEEGYYTIGDLREDGEEVVSDFVSALSMPRSIDQRFLKLSFQETEAEDEQEDPEIPGPAASGMMDPAWLQRVAPLYSMHMGCENMGPMLYSLVRFVKPVQCLEIGAGYTSAFLLQALEDNHRELCFWQEWSESKAPGPKSWLVGEEVDPGEGGCLHCIDNFAHEHSTAPLLWQVASQLQLQHRLRLHLDDARAFVEESQHLTFDFVWLDGLLDFAPPKKGDVRASIDGFLELLWPRLRPGALVLLHSTLTNSAVRGWLETIGERSPWGPPGAMLSLLEPHKKFQNSVTILQHRPEGFAEAIYSKLP